jgi:hypothetical protein
MENGYELPEKPGEPQVRLRVKHTRTAKDGWVLAETTVELVLPLTEGGAQAGSALLAGYQEEVHRIGAREAHRRNTVDGYA